MKLKKILATSLIAVMTATTLFGCRNNNKNDKTASIQQEESSNTLESTISNSNSNISNLQGEAKILYTYNGNALASIRVPEGFVIDSEDKLKSTSITLKQANKSSLLTGVFVATIYSPSWVENYKVGKLKYDTDIYTKYEVSKLNETINTTQGMVYLYKNVSAIAGGNDMVKYCAVLPIEDEAVTFEVNAEILEDTDYTLEEFVLVLFDGHNTNTNTETSLN